MNCTNQLLENSKKCKVTHLLHKIYGVQTQLICSYKVNATKKFDFHYVIDIFSKYAQVIPLKDKKVIKLLMLFKNSYIGQNVNQTKYGSES